MPLGPSDVRTASATALADSMFDVRTSFFLLLVCSSSPFFAILKTFVVVQLSLAQKGGDACDLFGLSALQKNIELGLYTSLLFTCSAFLTTQRHTHSAKWEASAEKTCCPW